MDQPNIVVAALKLSEDSDTTYILRIHEDRGEQVTVNLGFNFGSPVKKVRIVNSVEDDVSMEEEAQVLRGFDKER